MKLENADVWLDSLSIDLKIFDDCDLVLYQAGADAYIYDPFGGCLTISQLKTRDEIVFDYFKNKRIPVVFNLAGGYSKPFSNVIEIHKNTILAACCTSKKN